MGAQRNISYLVLGTVVSPAILQRWGLCSTMIKYKRWCEVRKGGRKNKKKETTDKGVWVLQLLDTAAALQFWCTSAAQALKHQIEWGRFAFRANPQFIDICITMWLSTDNPPHPVELSGTIETGKQKFPDPGRRSWDGWISFGYPSPSLESKKCQAQIK